MSEIVGFTSRYDLLEAARDLLAKVEPSGNWPAHENAYLISRGPGLIQAMLDTIERMAQEEMDMMAELDLL